MQFDHDWFTANIPLFQKYISHLSGSPCRILEIGCHEGRSTTWMIKEILTHEEASIDCIDVFVQDSFWSNIKDAGGLQKVTLHRGTSSEMLHRLPLGEFDFVYVDGSHWTQNVLEDCVLGFRLLKRDGIMCCDDYDWDDPEFNIHGCPKPAIDFFVEAYDHLIDVLDVSHQVWIRKRG